ncbi:N-acetylglucosamine kinase [Enterobacter sp. BIGb0383]|uniref:ROK family protein n=1 Tax=unclassified Enterobacter TaxID=2608935 RepID=UPI000F460115|nr:MULTISPECIES: ROK family protein [unclassified Enterobacter]ROP61997.1 N-acetylglucosamine kinase [Enterobacter sp. BIGb0383]ROS12158.1 N-acetylglucosamine kinase [Enterobacter sp. BIGb0359]
MYSLGLDIGGTKIAAVIIDNTGREYGRFRRDTVKNSYGDFLHDLLLFIQEIKSTVQEPLAIGIALPGGISPISGKIKNSNILVLNGEDLQSDLRTRLGQPVMIENDAACFALSEACDGAGRGKEVVFGLTLGTGCGGGIAIGQRLFSGAWGNAAECGHITLPGYTPETDGPPVTCYCGKQNCTESFVSGTGLAKRYLERCKTAHTAPEIIALAKQGEPQALLQVANFRNQLARLLATIVNIIDPHVIVIGGGLSNEPLLLDGIDDEIAPLVFTDSFMTPVLTAVHGDSSGMRGAAWLALRAGSPAIDDRLTPVMN